MLPFLQVFGRPVSMYMLMGAAGIITATFVSAQRAKRYGFNRTEPVYVAVFGGLGLVIGGTALFGIVQIPAMWQNRELLTDDFAAFAVLHFGGMVFYGGLFGAVGGIYAYTRYMRLNFGAVMAMTVPVLPLAHSVMRVGCFFSGCCHGLQHPPPLGVMFTRSIAAPNNVYLLPVQLYESAANLIIFAVLWLFTRKDRKWSNTAALYGLTYGTIRFLLEFLRGDTARGFIFIFSTSQIISAIIIITCALYLKSACKKVINGV